MRFLPTILAVAFATTTAWALNPVVEDPLVEGTEATVEPKVPTAKPLLFPVSASSDQPEQLTITATSSNPKVFVRVKTGSPLMKFIVEHTGDGSAADPTYTRTMVFQLFRDLAPETVGYMSGFAQGGFFDAPDTATAFPSRIFSLADAGAQTGQAQRTFTFQGGSPTGTTAGTLGFTYDNEFNPAAIFTGRGQLAAANDGFDVNKKGTNKTQYFITDGRLRKQDFQKTIFGQLTHGWDGLRALRATPRKATPSTEPTSPVKVTSSEILQRFVKDGRYFTDASLVIAATAPGTSTISVTATNAAGEAATRSFEVTVYDEPLSENTRPYVTPLADAVVPAAGQANLGFGVVDLERDYVPLKQELQSNGTTSNAKGISGFVQAGVLGVIGNPSYRGDSGISTATRYTGPLYPAVSATQYEMSYRGDVDGATRPVDNYSASTVGIGDSRIAVEEDVLYGTPGTALPTVAISSGSTSTQGTVVARFKDSDPRAQGSDVTAQINWGDGTALQSGTISTDTSSPRATGYRVTGTHTYARAGIYTATVTVSSPKGLRNIVRTPVVISSTPIKGVGKEVVTPGPLVANRILATFTDSASTGLAKSYTATVDWGDGAITAGTVRAAGVGKFTVVGRHVYRDAERFAVTVRVHKAGAPLEQDLVAWSSVILTRGFSKRHLPPFDQAHLVAFVSPVPVDHTRPSGAAKEPKETVITSGVTSQTYLSYAVQVLNVGNLPAKPGKLRFYLSQDKTVNLEDEKDSSGVVTNPKDIPLKIRDLGTNEFFLQGLKAGTSVLYYFEKSKYADYRLIPPANEVASGYNFLVDVDYTDPIADHEPIERVAVEGKINGIRVSPQILSTRESGTSGTFKVLLDREPKKTVTIPLAIDERGTNEGTLNKSSLIFTQANWNIPQDVVVTGKSDTPASGTSYGRDSSVSYLVLLKPATSEDPLFNGMDGPDVTVTNADRDSNILIPTTTFSTTEAAGGSHERTVTITLQREPTAPVSVTISVSKNTEAEIVSGTADTADPTKKVITFDPRDPTKTPAIVLSKSFIVRGKDDNTRDGNTTYTIDFQVSSSDPEFGGLRPPPITVTSVDDGAVTTTPPATNP